jgi:hypothetical protein
VSGNEIVEQPWAQPMPGENNRWFQRFSAYLDLGAGRSVRAVYNAEKGNERSKSVPASWSEAAHRYEWQRRAEAYDAYRRSQVFQAGNAADTERVRKLDDLIQKLYDRSLAMLTTAPPEEEFNDRLIAQLLAAVDVMAKHTGGYAPMRHEVSGKDGKAIQVESDAPAMQVVFYLPEVADLPEIIDASGDGTVATVDGTVEPQEDNDG